MSEQTGTINDPVLGLLKWYGDAWIGEWAPLTPKHSIPVIVYSSGEEESPQVEALPPAQEAFGRVRSNEWAYRLAAAKSLLGLYNDTWRDFDEPILDSESFARQLQLCSFVLWNDGLVTLCYDDQEQFFGGHCIRIDFDPEGVLIRTSIAG